MIKVVDLTALTDEEGNVLYCIKKFKKDAGEDHIREEIIHTMFRFLTKVHPHPMLESYDFELMTWEELQELPNHTGSPIPTEYSRKLHSQINSLVEKGYLIRNKDNPAIISINK